MESMWRFSPLLVQLFILQLTISAQAMPSGASSNDGEWGEWSPCSRSCGPAISFQQRNCSNANCGDAGPEVQFRSCPNRPCVEEVDLRRELCATFSTGNLTFSPLNNEGQCLLTCKATQPDGQMVVQGPLQVLPGTRCTNSSGAQGICVGSLCAPVGCDGIAGSRKTVDKCGRYTAPSIQDNRVCTRNSGTQTEDPTTGHVEMVQLPTGASSASVTNHLPPHLASLMVRSVSGDFLFLVGPPGHRFEAGGVEFEYQVVVTEGNFAESLRTNGTLNESVSIEVYIPSKRVAPVISYEYHTVEYVGPWGQTGERGEPPLVSTTNSIDWVYGHFLSCTKTCATGLQVAYALCKDLDFNRSLPDRYCSSEKPTPIIRRCGSGNCSPRWVTREWLACSETRCGRGSQQRLVQCMVLEASGRDTVVADVLCNSSSRPRRQRECVMRESSGCSTHWEEDDWGECCSQEPLERRIECVDSQGTPQPPFLCSHLSRNTSLRVCERGPCTNGGCSWVPKRWFTCNNTCGQGLQRRGVRCRNTDHKVAPASCCRDEPLPEVLRECYDDRAHWCQPQWHTGSWEQCRGECGEGEGERTRVLGCQAENRQDMYVKFPHSFCSNQSQPVDLENCTRHDPLCSNCSWETSQWSDCYCPVGAKIRTVTCSSGVDECCFQRQPYKPPEGKTCECPSTEPPPIVAVEDCTGDYPGVNCRQLKEDGYCSKNSTDFFQLLCCQTCSGAH